MNIETSTNSLHDKHLHNMDEDPNISLCASVYANSYFHFEDNAQERALQITPSLLK